MNWNVQSPGYGPCPDRQDTLQFVEICAGAHRLTDAFSEYGYQCNAMDAPCLQNLGLHAVNLLI